MTHNRFEKWLRNIFETREDEISCTECLDLVSAFVEREISGQDAGSQMPLVKQHLEQCRACRDEYETLRDLRKLEEENQAPSSDDLRDLMK